MPRFVACKKCSKATIIAAQEACNGSIQIGRWCATCEVWSLDSYGRPWIPHSELVDPSTYPIVRSLKTGVPCCVVGCCATSIEYHHFAPRELFDDADKWPRDYLCTYHHNLWHAAINKKGSR